MKRRGFTLIELLVVIAIIGILSGIVSSNLSAARQSARDGERVADLKNIQLSLALYYNDNYKYPCDIYTNPGTAACLPNFVGVYMTQIPRDPGDVNYKYAPINPLGSGTSCAGATRYHLGAVMETATALLQDDVDSAHVGACSSAPAAAADFAGSSVACTSASVTLTNDRCYDVTQQH